MNSRMRGRRPLVALCAALAAGVALAAALPAGTASANPSRGYVDGVGDIWDDLGDEATLGDGLSYWHSNYAGMWQAILYAEGDFSHQSDLDCEFGPNTAAATARWQQRYNDYIKAVGGGSGIAVTGTRYEYMYVSAFVDNGTPNNSYKAVVSDWL